MSRSLFTAVAMHCAGTLVGVNSVAPVFAGTIMAGNVGTITPGTWTGSPVLTYTLMRDGVAVAAATGLSLTAANAYLEEGLDCGPSLRWREIPNGVHALGVNSNALTFALSSITGYEIDMNPDVGLTKPGNRVSTASDQSGAGNHFTQAVGADQPLWVDAVINGHSVLRSAGLYGMKASIATAMNQPRTRFAVWRTTLVSTTEAVADGNTVNTRLMRHETDATFRLFAGSGPVGAGVMVANAFAVCYGVFSGASSFASVNGVRGSAVNAGTATANGDTILRAGNGGAPMTGDLARYIGYSAALTANECKSVAFYLGYTYAITVT